MKNRFAAFVWWIGAISGGLFTVFGLYEQYAKWKFLGRVNLDVLLIPMVGAGICAVGFGICYVFSGSFWKPPRGEE